MTKNSMLDKKRLSEVAFELLVVQHNFTDMLVDSDRPVMLRRASCNWVEAKDKDDKPLIFTVDEIKAFLNGIYEGVEKVRAPQEEEKDWEKDLMSIGSLHHAATLTEVYKRPESSADSEGEMLSRRVRLTVQRQTMGESICIVMRPLHDVPKDLASLGLPFHATEMLTNAASGLIVVTGPTGSGKSTTLAAMVNEINESRTANILTIEDPIEYIHMRKKGIINQREIGTDVLTFEDGVKDAFRFVPDVILIGEIRDAKTMLAALRAGASGHLVLTSLHAPTAVGAIRKMASYLPDSADIQELASCLVGVIAQALIHTESNGRVHLCYEFVNARKEAVVNAIISSAGDQTGSKLNQVEESLRSELLDGAIPMKRTAKELVAKHGVDPLRAASILTSPSDRTEVMQLGAKSK